MHREIKTIDIVQPQLMNAIGTSMIYAYIVKPRLIYIPCFSFQISVIQHSMRFFNN